MTAKKYTGILSIVFVMVIWGSTFAITKVIVNSIPPVFFAFIRFLIASVCLLPVLLFTQKDKAFLKLKRRDYLLIILMGLTGVTLYYISFNLSLIYTSASTGALIQGALPVCIALLGLIFLKEKLTVLQIFGIILSFIGVTFVGFLSGSADNQDSLKGNLLMISAVLCWSIYTILSRKMNHLSPLIVTCLSGFAGTIMLFFPALLEIRQNSGNIHLSLTAWFGVVYLGAIASALCYFLYNKALESLPAAQVGNFLNLDPIIGVIIAIVFLHESINGWQIAGAVLVLIGIFLSSVKRLK